MRQPTHNRGESRLTCPGFSDTKSAFGEQPAARPGAPRVSFRGTTVLVRDEKTGAETAVEDLARAGAWTLMAVFEDDGAMTAVFEEVEVTEGRIAFVREDGVHLQLAKSLEPTTGGGSGWYNGHRKEEALPAGSQAFSSMREGNEQAFAGQRDVMRYDLLEGARDPDPEAVRACFPPIRRDYWEGHERPHTFIGTPISADVIPLYYTDHTDAAMVWRVPTTIVAKGASEAIETESLWEGLVGGWLPVVRTVYPMGADACWDIVAFATPEGATTFLQPAWYRFMKLYDGRVQEVQYVDSFLSYPNPTGAEPAGFYRSLLHVHRYWHDHMDGGMRIQVPERWIEDFSRHAMARERITRRGDHPKYGVSDRAYGGEEHDGFQDLLTSTVTCYNEWGHFATSRAYLDYYFRHFVRGDGSIRYRGPQIGKYGEMLSCLAQYSDYTEDDSLLREHDGKVKAIVGLLLERWEEARRGDPGSAEYGMIKGYHEADINFLTPSLNSLDYERPYLANSAMAWRGLRDIASTWQRAGRRQNDQEMIRRAEALAASASELLEDARRGVECSWIEKDGVVGLPIIAGSSRFYWEALYRSCPESYDENRVWSELFWSGILSKDTVKRIMEIAGTRGGTTLGIFNNRYHIVAFLVSEAVHGLLQHDLVPEALLVFYAHAFHAHTRGTWTVRECVDLDRDRGVSTPYCSPAQMTVPTIAKWLLLFEDPIDRNITLGHGVPRAWLEDGKEFGVTGAPTRWGPVSYTIRSHLKDGRIDAQISLPQRHGATVRVRLRCPNEHALQKAEAPDRKDVALQVDGDTVRIPTGTLGTVAVRAWYSTTRGAKASGD